MLANCLPVIRSPNGSVLLPILQGDDNVVYLLIEPPVIVVDMAKGKPRCMLQSTVGASAKTPKPSSKSVSAKVTTSNTNEFVKNDYTKTKITDFFLSSGLGLDAPPAAVIKDSRPVVHNGCPRKNPSVSSVLKTSPTLINGSMQNPRTRGNGLTVLPSAPVTSPPSGLNDLPKKGPKKGRRRRLNISNTPGKHKPTRSPMTINRPLTEYYPIRRSCRQTRSRLMKEKQTKFEEILLSGKEEGLKVAEIDGKGRGVVSTKTFKKGEFVVEYFGELIDYVEAKRREILYAQDQNTGCYMYYFLHNNRRYCVDATEESGRLGRLINHSRNGNLVTKSFCIGDVPHLILVAKHDIPLGEELLYDYGDRSKASLESHPWLAM